MTGWLAPASVSALVRRPDLWPEALQQWKGLCPSRWWARWPPLPLPAPSYLAFRKEAMFGVAPAFLGPNELVAYLEWCRRMRSLLR